MMMIFLFFSIAFGQDWEHPMKIEGFFERSDLKKTGAIEIGGHHGMGYYTYEQLSDGIEISPGLVLNKGAIYYTAYKDTISGISPEKGFIYKKAKFKGQISGSESLGPPFVGGYFISGISAIDQDFPFQLADGKILILRVLKDTNVVFDESGILAKDTFLDSGSPSTLVNHKKILASKGTLVRVKSKTDSGYPCPPYISEITLANTYKFDDIDIPAGSTVYFNQGLLTNVFIRKAWSWNGLEIPKDTLVAIKKSNFYSVRPKKNEYHSTCYLSLAL